MFYISDLYKIKNLLPIIYISYDINSVAKFIILYDRIRAKYPEINFLFVVHDAVAKIFHHKFIMANSVYKEHSGSFAKEYILENGNGLDVVEKFCVDNKIEIFFNRAKSHLLKDVYYLDDKHKCLLEKKFKVVCHKVNDLTECKSDSFGIASAESPDLLYYGLQGRKIILIGQGNSKNSFQKMFPDTVLL